jgi:hypothetical protein
MGKFFDAISPELASFIEEQPMFFVGTAPLASSGHVNLSPKGLDTLRILSPNRVAYLDLTGSGNETAAHLQENGRITFMFCSFGKTPMILRLYGRGRVVPIDSAEWPEWAELFPVLPGTRQVIVGEIERVQTSCGFGVPLMDLVEPRETLTRWVEKKSPGELRAYWHQKNARSLDGLPAPGMEAPPAP